MDMQTQLKNFLEFTYDKLEELNLQARTLTDPEKAKTSHVASLKKEPRIKAVTVVFVT